MKKKTTKTFKSSKTIISNISNIEQIKFVIDKYDLNVVKYNWSKLDFRRILAENNFKICIYLVKQLFEYDAMDTINTNIMDYNEYTIININSIYNKTDKKLKQIQLVSI